MENSNKNSELKKQNEGQNYDDEDDDLEDVL